MDARTPNRLPFHRLPVFPVLLARLAVILLAAAALFFGWRGVASGYSGLCVGLIAWLPNLVFRPQGVPLQRGAGGPEHSPVFLCRRSGQADSDGTVLFALAFVGGETPVGAGSVHLFVLALSVGWFAPLLMKNKISRP